MKVEGFYFIGQVVGRTKRLIDCRDGEAKELVTYQARANGRDYFISHFAPKEYYPVSKDVQIPIYARVYVDRNGEAKISYSVDQGSYIRGESF